MAPNATSLLPPEKGIEENSPKNDPPPSTYPGIWKYPTNRDIKFRMAQDWIDCKRKDDEVENLWRVHDKLYNLQPFVNNHPGGAEWIDMSRGLDITELFEASHVKNVAIVESILAKYYVKDATTQRITPYTLKEDGFYMTLKRRTEPILKEIGTGPTMAVRVIQDSLIAGVIVFALLGAMFDSITFALISGTLLAFSTTGAHNFVHLKDNWRKYYMDLSLFSSHEFRITHILSHHMYPNTLLDMELHGYPSYEWLPNRPKPWIQRHFSLFYSPLVYASNFWADLTKRIYHTAIGKQTPRPENFLPFLELAVLLCIQADSWVALRTWLVMQTMGSFVMITIGATASHHHTTCFHDGDEPPEDSDFGVGQLDATKDRAENFFNHIFVTLVTFGHHPLHHLFPTVCHSKLPYLREVFEETAREFKLDYPGIPQIELYLECYLQLARTEPFKRKKNA